MAKEQAIHPESVLDVPRVEPVEFERNFIKTVVCELRFPTLLELETQKPVNFQKALRKEYPLYEAKLNVSVELGGTTTSAHNHVMHSKDRGWAVSLRPSALGLETSRYTNFEEFEKRLKAVLNAARPFIDSNFFTRVGLRYVNAVPIEQGKVEGWVNSALVKPLTDGVFGTVDQALHEIRGRTATGKYSFRHGIPPRTQGPGEYLLDFDLYEEGVEDSRVLDLVKGLHVEAFAFFSWALGEKALKQLGTARKKGR